MCLMLSFSIDYLADGNVRSPSEWCQILGLEEEGRQSSEQTLDKIYVPIMNIDTINIPYTAYTFIS